MITFPLVLRFPNKPRCPICQRDLNAAAIVFFDALAYCACCAQYATWEATVLEAQFACYEGKPPLYTRQYQLRFYAPPHDTPRDQSAAEAGWPTRSKGSPVQASLLDHARTFKPGTPAEYLP